MTSKCSVDGCDRFKRKGTMCNMHWLRWTRHGRTHKTVANHGEGRPKNRDGYIILTRNGKRVYEHVYLAEKALGKKLRRGAVVHHVNEDRSDNYTPWNLVVCPSQSYHALLHVRARKATEGKLDDE